MHVAIFASFSGEGGVERILGRLAAGLLEQGCRVDLVLARAEGMHLAALPGSQAIRVIRLGTRHTATAALPLARYIRRERPDAVLAAKDRAIRAAVVARALAGRRPRLVGRIGTTVSAALAGRARWRWWAWALGTRLFYPRTDAVVAVSEGVQADVMAMSGLGAARVPVIRNPVIGPDLHEAAGAEPAHPWLGDGGPPVAIGVGRLTRQKGFDVLLEAFAMLRTKRPVRLILLGAGPARAALTERAQRLGVADAVALPGFVANPWSWMARADLFVLASRWEGSPNALTEAMALGTPVVATDCPSGPREILDRGRIAPLVPVEEPGALASAVERAIEVPQRPEALRRAVAPYRVSTSALAYLRALGAGSAAMPSTEE